MKNNLIYVRYFKLSIKKSNDKKIMTVIIENLRNLIL